MPLGVFDVGSPRVEAEVALPHGGRLLLYTDGLVETRTEPLNEGLARLGALLGRHRDAPPDAVVRILTDTAPPRPHRSPATPSPRRR